MPEHTVIRPIIVVYIGIIIIITIIVITSIVVIIIIIINNNNIKARQVNLVTQEKRKKGWRMNCDVGETTEGLENKL